MAVTAPTFFDTSVLLAGLIDVGQSGAAAQRILDAIASGAIHRPQTAWHCCLEFYSVSTRLPEDLRLTPADALRLAEAEILGRFEVHQLREAARRALLDDAARDRVAGGRIYDAHIAEVARGAGAEIVVTDNARHFASLVRQGTRVLTSDEFCAWL